MNDALKYANDNASTFEDELKDFLRIPSVSTDPGYADEVRRCAEWVVAGLKKIGVSHVTLDETPGHPIVYATHIVDENAPTVLIYGHYDVQPPDPIELWDSPPFEPVVKDGVLYARGSSDDKGQVYMHVKAAEAWLKSSAGRPPLNLKFIIEGEEESGSANLSDYIEANKEKLSADVVMISDTALFAEDVPSITAGLRGLAYVEVELTGPDRDLHSGVYGGAVENPINMLAKMIGDLHNKKHQVTIDGFYDNVRPLTEADRAEYLKLPFSADAWKASIDVAEVNTEEGYTILEAITARPTLDVNGIWGGYQGEGAKTVLPSKASAKISMRLVPDQSSAEITEKIRVWFEANTPATMKLKFTDLHGGEGALVDTNEPAMIAAAEAMEGVYGKKPVFTREGGSIPVVAEFYRLLGLNTVLMGFGLNSDAIHSPNECFALDRFHKGISASIRFMEAFAKK